MFANQPDSDGKGKPDHRAEDERLQDPSTRQPDPKDRSESGKADAADGRSPCVDGGYDAAAIGSIEAGSSFVLFLMRFYQACARWKDGGKREKKTAHNRPEVLRDEAGEHADQPAEGEADDPFMRLDAFDRSEFSLDDHGSSRSRSQKTNDPANHTGIRATVAVRAAGL